MSRQDPFTPAHGTLLRAMAHEERERSLRHDPRWERLTESDLSTEDRESLRRLALESEDGEALWSAFDPLSGAALDRISTRLTTRIQSARPRRSYGRAVLSAAAVLSVAAVALGVCVGLQRSPPEGANEQAVSEKASSDKASSNKVSSDKASSVAAPASSGARLASMELPRYEIEVRGGDIARAVRGAGARDNAEPEQPTAPQEQVPIVLGPGATLEITLRPETAVQGPVSVVACLVREGRATPWTAAWQRSEQGALHVQGTRESLFSTEPPGEVTLRFLVLAGAETLDCSSKAVSAAAIARTIQLQ